MSDLFNFNRMITPVIITVIYWILLALTVIGGLVILIAGHGAAAKFGGLIELVVGPLIVRVYCELLIVVFKINESLTSIDKKTAMGDSAQ